MAKSEKKSKKVTSKNTEPVKAKPASSKEILAKASSLSKSAPKKSQPVSSSEDSDSSDEEVAPPPPKAAPAKNDESSSEDSDSSDEEVAPLPPKAAPAKKDESSSEESDSSDEEAASKPATAAPAKDDSSDGSSSEESGIAKKTADSSDESDSEESSSEENEKSTVPSDSGANKKRKVENETPVPPKKVKLANGDASATTSDEETKSIFVGRLSWNVDNDWLAQEFAECGEVESAQVQMDRNTGRSRGFGYVHFKSAAAVEKALAMNGREIDGRAVNVDKSTPSDKKASAEKRAQTFGDTHSPPSSVLFVGNLSFSASEDTLWEIFGEHGDVKSVRVPTDRDSGRPKGFAYVEFGDVEVAKKAHEALQGFELEGRSIRLDFSQPRDGPGGGGQGGRGGRGRGGFGGDRGRGGGFGGDRGRGGGFGGRGGFGGDRGRGGGRGGRGGDRGGRSRGRGGARSGGIAQFEGQKISFD